MEARIQEAKVRIPLLDLAGLRPADLRAELLPSLVGAATSIPAGLAYAIIAGLPPVMGLYAAALPTVVGSLLRSSRLVIVGPTNAISLILAGALATHPSDPVVAAASLAVLVGLFQLGAAALRLGAITDYLSAAVVAGYITGAATLILVGQLPNATGTRAGGGNIVERFVHWVGSLPDAHLLSVGLAVLAVALLLGLRRFVPRGVPSILAMVSGVGAVWWFDLPARGVRTVADLASLPNGLPPFSLPSFAAMQGLWPVAVAATVLSLVESSSVSRAIAERTGQRIDRTADFAGLGAANVVAGLFGGYPVSGSLGRSSQNVALGARTRLAGALSGAWVLLVPLGFAGVLDWTPLPTLAGIVLVIAIDLVDPVQIRILLRSDLGDRLAFAGTVLGTWFLSLDVAIYVGVGVSIVLFLRRARLLVVHELRVDARGRLLELEPGTVDAPPPCTAIRMVHVEGPLFFGAASELESALANWIDDPNVEVLVVRLKRVQGLDYTSAEVVRRAHDQLVRQGRHLILVGMRPDVMERLEATGLTHTFESGELFPTEPGWFVAVDRSLREALSIVALAHPGGHRCTDCPIERHLRTQSAPPGPAV